MGRPGRPTIAQDKQTVIDGVRRGLGVATAAYRAGIPPGSAKRWLTEDEAYRTAIARARAEWEDATLQEMCTAATAHEVNARKFLLERLRRQRYGEHVKVDTTVTQKDPYAGLSHRELARKLQAAADEANRRADEEGEP